MSNSYGKVYSPYEDLPSDVEPKDDDDLPIHGLAPKPFDNVKDVMGEDISTDISDITDVDSRIDTDDDDSVYAGLHEKLNLVINSHRLIIDRMDTFLENQRRIMEKLDANDDQ